MYGCTNEELYCSASLSHSASGRRTEATVRWEPRPPRSKFFFSSSPPYVSVHSRWGTCLMHSEKWPHPSPPLPPPIPSLPSGALTWVSWKAYWVKPHWSRHQQFGDGAEVGFHGDALQLHWIWGQEFCGVYWEKERERERGGVGKWRWWVLQRIDTHYQRCNLQSNTANIEQLQNVNNVKQIKL